MYMHMGCRPSAARPSCEDRRASYSCRRSVYRAPRANGTGGLGRPSAGAPLKKSRSPTAPVGSNPSQPDPPRPRVQYRHVHTAVLAHKRGRCSYPPQNNHQNTPTVPGRVPRTPAGPNYRTAHRYRTRNAADGLTIHTLASPRTQARSLTPTPSCPHTAHSATHPRARPGVSPFPLERAVSWEWNACEAKLEARHILQQLCRESPSRPAQIARVRIA